MPVRSTESTPRPVGQSSGVKTHSAPTPLRACALNKDEGFDYLVPRKPLSARSSTTCNHSQLSRVERMRAIGS
ncbi:MAG: hypothetical protein ACK559_28515, partial [bacterium]